MDSKLAEYAFFPLSHIFRENKTVPGRALEIALDCLQILIARGWRGKITPDLAKQLLVLLTFLAGGSATEASSKDVSEELSAAAFACLLSLLQVSDTAGLSSKTKVESANYPVLGHAVSVLLDGIANGPSSKVRLTALDALDALLSSLSDQEALKSFFPGIVSSLTKTLAFSNRPTSPYKIIRGCIQVLDQILLKVVSDESTRESDLNADESSGADSTLVVHNNNKGKGPWLEATSSQVKLALANILPLRYHNKEEVRMALFQLCMSVAGRCTSSLSHSLPMMVETSVVICTQASDTDVTKTMEVMISTMTRHHCLTDILMNCVREWMVALPRIMQSNDDLSKKRTIDQISTAFSIIRPQGVTLDTLDDVIGINLQASVVAAIQTSTANTIQSLPESNKEISPLFHPSSGSNIAETMFNPISQKVIITSLQLLLSQIKGLASSLTLWYKMAESLATTCGNEQLATLWLSIQYLSIPRPKSESDWILRGTRDQKDAQGYILDKIYNFSLSVLSRPTHDSDIHWRLQALALQALTLQACHQGFNFRPELVDALYPILERLGSSNAALQHQAITALSLVSDACGYTSPKELVIENVDYLVNAVAMDLNSYDIRPQAPQVLIMMTRLCGARLISYLDDIIETIFEILGSYHGYPKLVEAMFSVLNTIVEEESKASAAAITERAEPVSRVRNYNPISIQDLATQLREAHIEKPHLDPLPIPPDSEEACHENEEQLSDQPPPSDDPTPLSKSLRTLTSIATLTQHHLPTSSPSRIRPPLTPSRHPLTIGQRPLARPDCPSLRCRALHLHRGLPGIGQSFPDRGRLLSDSL